VRRLNYTITVVKTAPDSSRLVSVLKGAMFSPPELVPNFLNQSNASVKNDQVAQCTVVSFGAPSRAGDDVAVISSTTSSVT